jgi:hypothetical protein
MSGKAIGCSFPTRQPKFMCAFGGILAPGSVAAYRRIPHLAYVDCLIKS